MEEYRKAQDEKNQEYADYFEGLTLLYMGDSQAAQAKFLAYLGKYPKGFWEDAVYIALANVCKTMNNLEEASKYYEKSKRFSSEAIKYYSGNF